MSVCNSICGSVKRRKRKKRGSIIYNIVGCLILVCYVYVCFMASIKYFIKVPSRKGAETGDWHHSWLSIILADINVGHCLGGAALEIET